MGEVRDCSSFGQKNPEEKGPLGRPRRRWKDAIKVDVKGKGLEDVYWINLIQDSDN